MGAPTETGDLVGTTLRGRYELRRLLGRGGMGAVFAGFDIGLERAVAVKVILPRLAGDAESGEEMAARFRREARITAGVRHPHIVDVLDFDEDSSTGLLFLVMEQLDGRDLEKVLARERRLPPERAVRIVAQVCQAVAHAHRNGQVHRDLKPSNVMLVPRDDGTELVKVLDFGLARNEADATKLTATGQILGTALYMSPEQIDPRRGRITRSCDQYALGAVTYHLLSGRPPFLGASLAEILSAHLHETAPPLDTLASGLPEGLSECVARSLQKRADERFPSVDAFREALEAAVRRRGAPTPVTPEPVPEHRPPSPGVIAIARRGRPLTIAEEILRPRTASLLATAEGVAVAVATEADGVLVRLLDSELGGAGSVSLEGCRGRPTTVRVLPAGEGAWIVASLRVTDDGAVVSIARSGPGGSPEPVLLEAAPIAGGLTIVPSASAPPGCFLAAWHRAGPEGGFGAVLQSFDGGRPASRAVLPGLAFPSPVRLGDRILVAGHEPGPAGRLVRVFVLSAAAGPVAAPAVEGLSRPAFPVLAAGPDGSLGLAAWDSARLVFASLSPDGRLVAGPSVAGAASATPRPPALAALAGGFVACWAGPAAAPRRRPLLARFLRPGAQNGDTEPLVLGEGDVGDPQLLATGGVVLAVWTVETPHATHLHAARLSAVNA